MLISEIINDGIGLLSKQLKFYCWHYKRDLDSKQRQELIDLLNGHYFEKLASKIRLLLQSNIDDCKQQIGKLLFDQCLTRHRRNQLIQLLESDLVDINVRLDNYGRTLLHRSAYNLDVRLVKLLIDHGVNIRLRDYAGNTALHIAIQSYRNGALIFNNEPEVVQNLTSIIELLLEADRGIELEKALRKRVRLDPSVSSDKCMSNNEVSIATTPAASAEDGIYKANNHHHQPDNIQGQHLNLVTYQNSPPKNGTICRIIGTNCACRNQISGHQSSNNQLNDGTTDGANPNNLESHHHHQHDHLKETAAKTKSSTIQPECLSNSSTPMLMDEDPAVPLIDTKNAFGRTALHYCVLVVGEQHLDHFVSLLIAHEADVDVIDTRLKTPLYCLVKRPGVSAVRQKCLAITKLIENGCDDLGLALEQPSRYFNAKMVKSLESSIAETLSKQTDEQVEPIFTRTSFKRVPTLKHLTRLSLIKINSENGKLRRQTSFRLPADLPHSLNFYVNRKILDQSELF